MQVPQQQMCANRVLPHMHERVHNLRNQRVHQAPPGKLAYSQRAHDRVRPAHRQRVRYY